MKAFKWFVSALLMLVAFAGSAFADGLTAPTIDTADFYTIGGALVGALAALWVLRRAIHLLGR